MSDVEAHAALLHQLESGEVLVWHGKPIKGFGFNGFYLSLTVFGILLLISSKIFVIKMLLGVDQSLSATYLFSAAALLFVSLLMLLGPQYYDYKQCKNTIYGITPNRVIIVSGFLKSVTYTYRIREMSKVTISESSDGTGKIFFGDTSQEPNWQFQRGAFLPHSYTDPQFAPILKCRDVYDILKTYHNREKAIP